MSAPNKRARMAESLPAEQLVGGLPVFREGEASEELLTDFSYFVELLNNANNGVARAGVLACQRSRWLTPFPPNLRPADPVPSVVQELVNHAAQAATQSLHAVLSPLQDLTERCQQLTAEAERQNTTARQELSDAQAVVKESLDLLME